MNININNNLKIEIDKIINLYKQKNFRDALILSNKVIEKDKNIPFLLNLNGLINLSLEKWHNAIFAFKKALDADDKFVEAYNNIGVAYSHIGDDKKAVENYTLAIRLKKDYANGYNNLASHYDDLGQYSEAVINYNYALKFNPENLNAQNNLIHLLNYFNPKNSDDNSIVKANFLIKKIKTDISILKHISDLSLFEYLTKCNQILKKNIKNLSFFDSQIHRRNGYDLNCNRHHKAFNKFNIIPKYCFSCFKIQIELTTVSNLIRLFFIFDQLRLPKDNIRKCFIELRPGIPGTYKGLIYCSSIEEAESVFEIVKPYMQKLMLDNFDIKIKRGCTEFDLAFPGYKKVDDLNKIVYDEEWTKKEELIDHEISNGSQKGKKVFNRSLSGTCLGDILIINNWLNYAKLLNDKSYKKITDEIFFSEYIFQAVEKRNSKI
jgi:tetratricopeptide (TPR) repeat protein|tara:strand:+ start:179 stop:1480 length:1302 start_codon:yes stop_codon:yes gene_type:complete